VAVKRLRLRIWESKSGVGCEIVIRGWRRGQNQERKKSERGLFDESAL
jgi:hypothetical protein